MLPLRPSLLGTAFLVRLNHRRLRRRQAATGEDKVFRLADFSISDIEVPFFQRVLLADDISLFDTDAENALHFSNTGLPRVP
jgi:hypothetical protein